MSGMVDSGLVTSAMAVKSGGSGMLDELHQIALELQENIERLADRTQAIRSTKPMPAPDRPIEEAPHLLGALVNRFRNSSNMVNQLIHELDI